MTSLDPDFRVYRRNGRQIIASMAQGGWSGLGGLLDASTIGSADQSSYAMATSLTEYLLSQGDVGKLLQFAADGKGGNWDGAVQQHYGSRGVADLEAKWHAWAAAGTQHASAATWPNTVPLLLGGAASLCTAMSFAQTLSSGSVL